MGEKPMRKKRKLIEKKWKGRKKRQEKKREKN